MKKWLCIFFVLVCLGSGLFANASRDQGSSGGKTKIVFWHSMPGTGGDAVNALVSAFNASQDRYEVEAQFQGSYPDGIAKLKATPQSMVPDIMQLYDLGTRWAVDSGLMLRIQDFIDADNYDISDYEPNILAYYALNGILYSMPFNCSTPVVFYNREALTKAGLDPAKAFETLDSALETARALQASGMAVGGSFLNDSWLFEQFMSIQNKFILDNGNGRRGRATKIDNTDALLATFAKFRAFVQDPACKVWGQGGGDAPNQFTAGNLGFYFGSCGGYVGQNAAVGGKFSIGFAPLPKVNPGDRGGVSVGGGSLWMIDSGNKERQQGAWEFIKFASSAKQQAQWSMYTGYIPIRKSAQALPEYQDYIRNKNPEIPVAIDALRNSTPQSAGGLTGVYPQIRVIIQNEVERMVNDPSVSPQQVLNQAVQQINSEITMYNRTN
jgi:sn-glycerol 3-phosphate transport system substrate-binding protein